LLRDSSRNKAFFFFPLLYIISAHMSTVGFPSPLHALNETLSACITSKNLKPLHLKQVFSFETFIKTLYPHLMRYTDNQTPEELTLLKHRIVQVFPRTRKSEKWHQLFSALVGTFSGTQTEGPLSHDTVLECSSLVVNLSPQHRYDDLEGQYLKNSDLRQKAETIQKTLWCLIFEDRFMHATEAEIAKEAPLLEVRRQVQNQTDGDQFASLVKYAANHKILNESLECMFAGKKEAHGRYKEAKVCLDAAAPRVKALNGDQITECAWAKFQTKGRFTSFGTAVLVSASEIFQFVAPLGSLTFLVSKTADSPTHLSAICQRYFELRPQQAAFYDLLYTKLYAIYDKQHVKRQWIAVLKDPTGGMLPKQFEEVFKPKPYVVPAAVPATTPSRFVCQLLIGSYTQNVANRLSIPAEIPQESKKFWELAGHAFTPQVECFLLNGRQAFFNFSAKDDLYLLPVEMRRANGETKRGIINIGVGEDKRCFYRQFMPLTDVEIIDRVSTNYVAIGQFENLPESLSQRAGEVELPPLPSTAFTLNPMTLVDERLGLTIRLFPTN
jgi:hypothetical protein